MEASLKKILHEQGMSICMQQVYKEPNYSPANQPPFLQLVFGVILTRVN